MMSLEEAIKHYEDSETNNKMLAETCVSPLAKNHNLEHAEKCRQMIEWLRELQERRKKDNCSGCMIEDLESVLCLTCKRYCKDKYRTERRTDDKTNKGSSC